MANHSTPWYCEEPPPTPPLDSRFRENDILGVGALVPTGVEGRHAEVFMNYRNLGNTGLRVSVVGLGCGGPSRLGQRDGKSPDHSVNLVRKALDLGVNLLDTAETYGTEEIVGAALRDVPRDRVVLSAKKTLPEPDDPDPAGTIRSGTLREPETTGHGLRGHLPSPRGGGRALRLRRERAGACGDGFEGGGQDSGRGHYRRVPREPASPDAAAGPARPLVGCGHGRLQSAEPVGAPKRVPPSRSKRVWAPWSCSPSGAR